MSKTVDFGITRQGKAASYISTGLSQEGMEAAYPFPPTYYFCASVASTNFNLPTGRQFSLGKEYPNWLITENIEEAMYLRENFINNSERNAIHTFLWETSKEEFEASVGKVTISGQHKYTLEERLAEAEALTQQGQQGADSGQEGILE